MTASRLTNNRFSIIKPSMFVLYDVIDMFNFKYISNKIYLQGLAKCRKYDEEKYPYKIGYYKI